MTIGGWIFMLLSCGAMIILTAWCYYKVIATSGTTEHMHAPLDIDTHDTEDAD